VETAGLTKTVDHLSGADQAILIVGYERAGVMALDVHLYQHGKMGPLLYQIDDKTYGELYPAFERFRSLTGVFVNPYGDSIITVEMSSLLSCLPAAGYAQVLLSILKTCHAKEQSVIFVGD
jgi:hypothetical protein